MEETQKEHDLWDLSQNLRATVTVLAELSSRAFSYADDCTKAYDMTSRVDGLLANINSLIEAAQTAQYISPSSIKKVLSASAGLENKARQYKHDLQRCLEGSEDDIGINRPSTIYKLVIKAIEWDAKKYGNRLNDLRNEIKALSLMQTEGTKEIEDITYSRAKSVSELIEQGESNNLEFKETFQYNIERKEIDKKIRHDALRTIAGFLNTDGGTLLIGISDSGEVKGIDIDKKTMKRANNDQFELAIRNHITSQGSRFEPKPFRHVNFEFEELQDHTICIIDVQPLPKTEILHFEDDIYIRDGNQTLKLKGPALTNWIQQRTINKSFHINQAQEDEPQNKKQKAKISAKLKHLQKYGRYELIIKNNGAKEARDVKVKINKKLLSEFSSIEPKLSSIPVIGIDSDCAYHWRCNEPERPPFEIEITWIDDSGEIDSYRTTLSHPTVPKTTWN